MIEKMLSTTAGHLKVRMPTILNEITIGQTIELQEKHYLNNLEAIGILSGISAEELNTVINFDDLDVFGDYIQSLVQQIKYLYNNDLVPHRVLFKLGKRNVAVKVSGYLSVEPAGAFLTVSDLIADEINRHIVLYGEESWREHFQPSLKACSNVLAHYFFCRATGKKYEEYEAWEFVEEIKKLRVTEALPVAKYFFSAYPNLLKQKTSIFQWINEYWRRKKVFRKLKGKREITGIN